MRCEFEVITPSDDILSQEIQDVLNKTTDIIIVESNNTHLANLLLDFFYEFECFKACMSVASIFDFKFVLSQESIKIEVELESID